MYVYVCVPTPIRYYNLSHQIFAEINAPCMNSALLEFKSHPLLSSAAVTVQNSSVSSSTEAALLPVLIALQVTRPGATSLDSS